MTTLKEELKNPGDVILEKCELESITGDRWNILDILSEINIYEDIFSNGVTGNVFIVDSVNLINMAPIIGQEIIRIKFKTPVIDPVPIQELTFQIYKISSRIKKNDRTQGYVLHFASLPTIRNQLTKISRTLTGQISDVILDIIDEDLDADLGTLGTTKGSFQFVIPHWSPYKTLNWLAKRAITGDANDTNYVFYETINDTDIESRNGLLHNFVSIGQLFNQFPRSDIKYSFGPINRTLDDTGKELYPDINATYYTINEYEILEAMDNMESIERGMYASRLVQYDLVTKQITHSSFDYLENFAIHSHLDGKKPPDPENPNTLALTIEKENPAGFKYHDFADSHIKRIDSHDLAHTSFPTPYRDSEWALQRQSSMQQLKMNRLRCVVPGNSILRAGNVFDLNLPTQGPDAGMGKEDSQLSGKYLITSLRHKIQKGSYFTAMEMAKDTFYTPIAETTKNNR